MVREYYFVYLLFKRSEPDCLCQYLDEGPISALRQIHQCIQELKMVNRVNFLIQLWRNVWSNLEKQSKPNEFSSAPHILINFHRSPRSHRHSEIFLLLSARIILVDCSRCFAEIIRFDLDHFTIRFCFQKTEKIKLVLWHWYRFLSKLIFKTAWTKFFIIHIGCKSDEFDTIFINIW